MNKPSKAELLQNEFYLGVKDLATSEIEYRRGEKKLLLQSQGDSIADLLESLKYAREEYRKNELQCNVLEAIVENRR